ncbi:MAG: hypothetical protein ABJN42_14410 [Roseibium sp.]|uniref:hypothetical protein n=1 Tax=Roseibium sp. TaxID=1936156 RepID=UPI00329874C8
MNEPASAILRRIALKGTVLSATFGVLHVASVLYEAGKSARTDLALDTSVTPADDDIILRHGSRAWGAYLGLQESGESISLATSISASHLSERIEAVVNEETAPIAEAEMDIGQQEFIEGKWSQEAILDYTNSVLSTDRSIREGPLAEALREQSIPAWGVTIAARAVATVDSFLRTGQHTEEPNTERPEKISDFLVHTAGYDDIKVAWDENLKAALHSISVSYQNLDSLRPERRAQIDDSTLENTRQTFDF